MSRARIRGAAIVIAASAVFFGVASCISDRSTGPLNVGGCNVQLPPESFGSTIVIIRDFTFNPSQVTVKAGARVTWVNCGPAGSDSHTSTSDGPSSGSAGWASQLMEPGATFTHQFNSAGSFSYHCEPHPNMTGTVTVN